MFIISRTNSSKVSWHKNMFSLFLPSNSLQSSTFSTSGWYQGHEGQQEQKGEKYQQSNGQIFLIVSNKINNKKHNQRKTTDKLY